MRSGKFRKQILTFDLRESIQEVLNIQEYKSQQMGIKMIAEFENFEALSKLDPKKRRLSDS